MGKASGNHMNSNVFNKFMARLRPLATGLAILAGLFLSACTSIPQAELQAFTDAVTAAKNTSETIVADWQAAKSEFQRRQEARKPPPPVTAANAQPFPFERTPISARTNVIDPGDARLLAWEAIGEYTNTLARLNAGESVDTVKKTSGRLFEIGLKISGCAIPGSDALVAILQELSGMLEKARLAAEFNKAIKAGTPVIIRIIDQILLPDIQDHYRLRAVLASDDNVGVVMDASLSPEDKRLKQKRIADQFAAFGAAMDSYESLLIKTKATISAMETPNRSPDALMSDANNLLDTMMALKKNWAAFQSARTEGHK
jgi:hypothetical protein